MYNFINPKATSNSVRRIASNLFLKTIQQGLFLYSRGHLLLTIIYLPLPLIFYYLFVSIIEKIGSVTIESLIP